MKVISIFICVRAKLMAVEHNMQDFVASSTWCSNFLQRNDLALRRMTNLTTLTDDQLVQQDMSFIEANRHKIDLS